MKFFKAAWFFIYFVTGLTISFSQVPTSGLVAYYPFNGNANDESGNGWNGAVNGATLTTDRFGISNKSYYFDGSNDYISTSFQGILGNQARTISLWAKTTNSSNWMVLVSYGTGGLGSYFISFFNGGDPNREGIGPDLSSGAMIYNCNISDGNWHHYVWVVPTSSDPKLIDIKLYCDGQLLTSVNFHWSNIVNSQNLSVNTQLGQNVEIGRYSVVSSSYFIGSLDDIRIFNRALSDSEIQSLYNESNALDPPTLVSPTNSQSNLIVKPTFNWLSSNGATSYTLQISSNSTNWSNPVVNQSNIATTYFTLTSSLSFNTTYFWRLAVTNAGGISSWSEIRFFSTLQPDISRGVNAYYPFNGNANDESGNGWNGTVQGATLTTDRFGNSNKAYLFDGSNDYIGTSFQGILGKQARTISLWAKTTNSSNWMALVSYGTAGVGSYFISFFNGGDPNREGIGPDLSSGAMVYNCNISDGNWHHYTWVVPCLSDPKLVDIKLYCDGQLLTSVNYHWNGITNSQNLSVNTQSGQNVEIGRYSVYPSYFIGSLDDIRIYNRELDESEIPSLFNETVPPSAPILLLPVNIQSDLTTKPVFSWQVVGGAINYTLQVSGSSTNWSSPIINQSNITATSFSLTTPLLQNTTYYWRVSATHSGGTSDWSNVWSFKTYNSPTISGTITNNGTGLGSVIVTLSGEKDSVCNTTSSGNFGFTVNANGNYTITPNKTGYTFNPVNKSFTNIAGNQTQNFTATMNIPEAPVLSQPTNASTNQAINPSLSWNSSVVASSYRLQVSTINSFSSTVFDQSGLATTSQQISGLSNSTSYYWRVNATNSTGTSAWSSVWSFTTQGTGVFISVSLPSTTASPNTSIEVPITVGSITGQNIVSFQFTITYGSTVLTAKSDVVVAGTLSGTTGWSVTPNTNTPGQITIGGFGSNPLSGSGTLLKLKFDVIGNTGTSSPLNFSNFSFNNGVPAVTTTNGNITVSQTILCGDASNDGVVNAYDAAKTLRHAIGLEVLTTQGQINADVNKDGSIMAFDAALILRRSIDLPMPAGVTTTCWGSGLSKTGSTSGNIDFIMLQNEIANTNGNKMYPLKIVGNNEETYSISFDVSTSETINNISFSGISSEYISLVRQVNNNFYKVAIINGKGIDSKDLKVILGIKGNELTNGITISNIMINENNVSDKKIMNSASGIIENGYDLVGAYPNPFNPSTTISYVMPEAKEVKIEIYNILGVKIRTLVESYKESGSYNTIWDARDEDNKIVSAGLYYCRMKTGDFQKTIKLSFVK